MMSNLRIFFTAERFRFRAWAVALPVEVMPIISNSSVLQENALATSLGGDGTKKHFPNYWDRSLLA
jgi:hypothetical protein